MAMLASKGPHRQIGDLGPFLRFLKVRKAASVKGPGSQAWA